MTTGSTDLRPPWMPQASRWLLALGIAGSALAVGTVHTVTLCIVTVVLAAAVEVRTETEKPAPGSPRGEAGEPGAVCVATSR